jgi:hypothetical protein
MSLSNLNILDLSAQLDNLPKHPGYSILPPRNAETYITFHYSGVMYADRSHGAEIARIIDETQYQLNHNYGLNGATAYPDGLLYDFVVLSDGTIVRTRGKRVQLWHCGNATGNRQSWSVHVMLGPNQDLLSPQRVSTVALFDALRADGNIPRENVVGHCEWPHGDGPPDRTPTYRLLPGQSACPGAHLFPAVAAYRAGTSPPPPSPVSYRVRGVPVYEGPAETYPVALQGTAYLTSGMVIEIDRTYSNGMGHLASGLGFVRLDALERLI